MFRGFWFVVSGVVALSAIGCGDDGAPGAPETILEDRPAALTREQAVEITFRAEGAANNFSCILDGDTPQDCDSPFTATVADGPHTFEVAAGFGGRVDDTPAMVEWVVDSTPPETTITIQPPALDNSSMPSFAFEATDAMTVSFECSIDGGPFTPCSSPFTFPVGDGEHTFSVRGVDAAGNVDATPATFTWTVDTAAPDTMITSGPAAGATTAAGVAFAFTASEASATFECAVDGAAFAPCTSPRDLTLPDGAHTFAVRAVDPLGEVDPSPAMRAWTVDAVAPTTMITSAPANPSNDATPTYAFSSPDGGIAFECAFDAGAFAACASPFTPAANLADGTRTFRVRATDAVGNVGEPAVAAFTLDTVAPTVTITGAPAALSNDTTPTVAFTTAGAPTLVQCAFDANPLAACTSGFTAALPDGAHTVVVRVADAAGNASMATAAFTIDATPPVITLTNQPGAVTADNTPNVMFTVTGAPTSVSCRVDSGTPTACTASFTAPALADGPHTITVTAVDAATNTATASAMFTVDTVGPTVTITSGPNGPTADNTPTFAFTAPTATTIECRFDTAAFAACTSPFTAGTALADGAHVLEVRARDSVGNPGTATRAFSVDTTPPTLAFDPNPPAATADNTPTFGFVTSGGATTITCAVDGGAPAACTSPHTITPSLIDGPHTLVVRAADALGNAVQRTASFTVDTTPPTVTIANAPPTGWPVNYFAYTFTAPGAAAIECAVDGGAFVPCASPRLVQGTGATTTFAVRARDALGNQGSASTSFTATPGLVLHYPWEQGQTRNTSLLAQVPDLSPAGDVAALDSVGGWAGTALGRDVPAHRYAKTILPLSSSLDGGYTASFWVRVTQTSRGLVLSTKGASNGLTVELADGGTLLVSVLDGSETRTVRASVAARGWVSVGLVTGAGGKDLIVYVNGIAQGIAGASNTGFGAGQDDTLTVGPLVATDLDDLRFYNRALTSSEMMSIVARGVMNPQGGLQAGRPAVELDHELGAAVNTGYLTASLFGYVFAGDALQFGDAAKMGSAEAAIRDFASVARSTLGHTFTSWFVPTSATTVTLLDYTEPCNPQIPAVVCGLRVTYAGDVLTVLARTPESGNVTSTFRIIPGAPNNVVLAEQRSGSSTVSLTVLVNRDGRRLTIGGGMDLFGAASGADLLLPGDGVVHDEWEFWPMDLTANPEWLCENGYDDEWLPATGACGSVNR